MKKQNLFKLLFLVLFALVLLAGCGEKEDPVYEVSFDTDGGTAATVIQAKKASDINLPAITKEGYTLVGWFVDSAKTIEFTANYDLNGNITLYAKWEKAKFTVKFLVNGNSIEEQTVEYGDAAVAPAAPDIEGYTFDGWDKEFTTVKSNLEVNAKLNLKKYTVKFMDGAKELSSQEVEYGKAAVAPTNTEKAGYNFKNWDKEFSNITSHLVVNAVYEAKEFNIVYYDGEATLNLAPAKVTFGEIATLPSYSKAGTIFIGWFKKDGLTQVENLNDVTEDLELYAKCVTVKYYDGETEITGLEMAKIENDLVVVPDYNAEGYVFAGWYYDSQFKEAFNNTFPLISDINLYALSLKIEYNGGAASWTNGQWDATNTAAKGIDAISDLPEFFEKDFYEYLAANNLLNDSALGADLKVSSFEQFSQVNPIHSGDPKRIWNDSSTNKASSSSDGYAALFLYKTLELDANGNLVDINGGFLGTEPYKTKYFNLMQHLVVMFPTKYATSDVSADSVSSRQLVAFILDGYFYGTQSISTSDTIFKDFRNTIPTTTTYYTWDGTKAVANTKAYVTTTDTTSIDKMLAVPFKTDGTFAGWFTDQACTTALTKDNLANKMTVYAKWN